MAEAKSRKAKVWYEAPRRAGTARRGQPPNDVLKCDWDGKNAWPSRPGRAGRPGVTGGLGSMLMVGEGGQRDSRLGRFAQTTRAGTDAIGLEEAARRTLRHIAVAGNKAKVENRPSAMEIAHLEALAGKGWLKPSDLG